MIIIEVINKEEVKAEVEEEITEMIMLVIKIEIIIIK